MINWGGENNVRDPKSKIRHHHHHHPHHEFTRRDRSERDFLKGFQKPGFIARGGCLKDSVEILKGNLASVVCLGSERMIRYTLAIRVVLYLVNCQNTLECVVCSRECVYALLLWLLLYGESDL